MFRPSVKFSGIVDNTSFLNCDKKCEITLSGSLNDNKSCIVFTGLGLYLPDTPDAPEETPVTVSPSINLSSAVMNNLPFNKSSVSITAVALEVSPLIVSPFVNLPNDDCSCKILEPASI